MGVRQNNKNVSDNSARKNLNKLNLQPFEIHVLEDILSKGEQRYLGPRRHTNYSILYIREGRGELVIDTKRERISENTIYCLLPNQVHSLDVTGNTSGYLISFEPDFPDYPKKAGISFIDHVKAPFCTPIGILITKTIIRDIEDIMAKMRLEFVDYLLLREEILRGYLKILFVYLNREISINNVKQIYTNTPAFVKKFFSLLGENFKHMRQVCEYANLLSVTPNYLNESIKKISGNTASYHIQQQVVLEAKRQALHSDLSMKEIAYDLGFLDNMHFSKYFKNISGSNFSDYRKANV